MKDSEDFLTQATQECQFESLPEDPVGFLGINGKEYVLINGINKVGRRKDTCNIFLDLESVSREHAAIVVKSIGNISLFDLKSENKTKLNMRELQPFVSYPLNDGDVVHFGDVCGVLKLYDNGDELPMTQDMGVPDTPVFSRSNFKSHTTVPETPDVDKDESFNMSRNSSRDYKTDGIFLQPNRPAVKRITNSSKRNKTSSTKLKFDFDTSIVESVMPNYSNSVHELETQLPSQVVDIFNAETQIPPTGINDETVVSNMPFTTKGQSHNLLEDIDIFNAETQLPSMEINNEKIQSNVTSATKEQHRSSRDIDVFNADTQLPSMNIMNERVKSNNKNLIEKEIEEEDKEINLDVEVDEFIESFESQSLLTNVEEKYTIIKTEANQNQAERNDLNETKCKIENVFTETKNIMVATVDNDLTDCEDEDIFEDTVLPEVQEIPKWKKDISELETQIISSDSMTVKETTSTSNGENSKNAEFANNATIVENDLGDLPTQIIASIEVTSNVNSSFINDMPTQILNATDTPSSIKNKTSKLTQDANEENYYAATQQVFDDLISPTNSMEKIKMSLKSKIVENDGKPSKSNDKNKCTNIINADLTNTDNDLKEEQKDISNLETQIISSDSMTVKETTSTSNGESSKNAEFANNATIVENDLGDLPTQIIASIEVTSNVNSSFINDMPTQILNTTDTPSSLKNKTSQLTQDANEENYYAATQQVFNDLISPTNSMDKIKMSPKNKIVENDGKPSKSNDKNKCTNIINADNDLKEEQKDISDLETQIISSDSMTEKETTSTSNGESSKNAEFANNTTIVGNDLEDLPTQIIATTKVTSNEDNYYAATQEVFNDLISPNNSMENINQLTQILEDDIKTLKNDKKYFTKNFLCQRVKGFPSKVICDDFGLNQVHNINDNFDKDKRPNAEEKCAPNRKNNHNSSMQTQIIGNVNKEITSKSSVILQTKNKQSERHNAISKHNKNNNDLELNDKLCIEEMPTQIIDNHLTSNVYSGRQLRGSNKNKYRTTKEKIYSKTNKLSTEDKCNIDKKVNKRSSHKEKEILNSMAIQKESLKTNVNTKNDKKIVLRNKIVNELEFDNMSAQLLEFEDPPKIKDENKKDKTTDNKKETKKVNEFDFDDMPTQLLEIIEPPENKGKKKKDKTTHNKKETKKVNELDFGDTPTQLPDIVEPPKSKDKNKKERTTHSKKETKKVNEFYDMPTQLLEIIEPPKTKDKNSKDKATHNKKEAKKVIELKFDDLPTQLLRTGGPPKTKDKTKKDNTTHNKKQTKKVNEDICKHSESKAKDGSQQSIKKYMNNTKDSQADTKKQNENKNVTEPRRSQRKRKAVSQSDSIYTYENNNETRLSLRSKSLNKTQEQSAIYDTSNSGSVTRKRPALDVEFAPSKKKNKVSAKDTTLLATSRTKRARTCKVLFTALSNDLIREKLIELGAVIVNEIRSCTVVVTHHIKRTFKMMCAVGLGKPIVGESWIQACCDTQSIVDPWQYLIEDPQAEKDLKFNLRLTLEAERNFLKGYNVSSTPGLVPAPTEMKEIVECSGGKWQEGGARWLCVYSSADRALLPTLRERGATLISRESFLGAIMRQNLDASDILWN